MVQTLTRLQRDLRLITQLLCLLARNQKIPTGRPNVSAHLQHGLRLVEELFGLLADGFVVEDLGVASVGVATPQLPHLQHQLNN